MKAKPLVYLLGFLVLGIWGMVLYRIFISVHDERDQPSQLAGTVPSKKAVVPKLYPDTFLLILDYPDPFSGELVKIPDTSATKKELAPAVRQLQQPLQAPAISPVQQMKYLGFVSDGKGNQRVAIVSFQGTERLMKEGDTLKQVKVLTIKKNDIILSYQGKITAIKTE